MIISELADSAMFHVHTAAKPKRGLYQPVRSLEDALRDTLEWRLTHRGAVCNP